MAKKKAVVVKEPEPPKSAFLIPANVGAVAKCCDTESTRYALGGFSLSVTSDGKYEAAATDGKRLAIVSGDCLTGCEPVERRRDGKLKPTTTTHKSRHAGSEAVTAIVSPKDWKAAAAMSTDGKKTLSVKATDNGIQLACDASRVITTAPVEGRFPKYRDVLPTTKPKHTILLDANKLITLLQVAKTFSKNGTVALHFRNHDECLEITLSDKQCGGQDFTGLLMPLVKD